MGVADSKDWRQPWLDIRNYEDLVYVSGAFVAGKIRETPYHAGPLEDESIPLIPELITLHRYGLVTVNSQPATDDENQFTLNNREHPNGYYYDERQRPYVEFFMPNTAKRAAAIQAMFNDPSRYAVSIAHFDGRSYNDKGQETTQYEKNFDETLVVTEDRGAETIEALKKEPWRAYSRISPHHSVFSIRAFDDFPNIAGALAHTVCVTIASVLPFGEGNVIDDLHTQLVLAGNKPMYDVKLK